MIVAGGYYGEICHWPDESERLGSGGRAALAIADSGIDVDWHYYCPKEKWRGVGAAFGANVRHFPEPSEALIEFYYYHSLSRPTYQPTRLPVNPPLQVEGDVVLRFGFMEGDAIVSGARVVYDPQQPSAPQSFAENGSTAESLAIVLNANEVKILGMADNESEAVANITKTENASVVIVKAGAEGCRLYEDGEPVGRVPAYQSDSVYKIGSGDVFSAAFAYHWGKEHKNVLEAADAASRCTSRYCGPERKISVVLNERGEGFRPVAKSNPNGKVYLAAPFFNLAELWLVEEVQQALGALGVDSFSPFHQVGLGGPEKVVEADLAGLEECSALLALTDGFDPGTILEVGYAIKMGIPIVALAMNPKSKRLTMIQGARDTYITDDFASAIYRAAWACWR